MDEGRLQIEVRLFGPLRTRADGGRMIVHIEEGWTLADVAQSIGLEDDLDHMNVALDGVIGDVARPVHAGAEVAFLPPVSGG